ncbi:unnamed protein product, partial [Iphiclides podalirius]
MDEEIDLCDVDKLRTGLQTSKSGPDRWRQLIPQHCRAHSDCVLIRNPFVNVLSEDVRGTGRLVFRVSKCVCFVDSSVCEHNKRALFVHVSTESVRIRNVKGLGASVVTSSEDFASDGALSRAACQPRHVSQHTGKHTERPLQ